MNDNKKSFQNEREESITKIIYEIEKMKKEIKDLNIKLNKKEDDLKNIINEKDIIINELNNKLNQQEKQIKNNNDEVKSLKEKIYEINKITDELNNNVSKDLIDKENKIISFNNKLSNIQNENKDEIKKSEKNIKNDFNALFDKIYDKYIELNYDNYMNSKINENQLKDKKIYKVIVIGEAGVGKSQFCNFVNKDQSNSLFKINQGLTGCTKNFSSKQFNRLGIDFEFIDTPGIEEDDRSNSNRNINDLYNLKKEKKFDYIIFIQKFLNIRISECVIKYIKDLNNIFTAEELFTHSCIVFTHYNGDIDEDNDYYKKLHEEQLNNIFNEAFAANKNKQEIFNLNKYYVNTRFRNNNNNYNEKNQKIIDNMLKQIKIEVDNFGSISSNYGIKDNIENIYKYLELRKGKYEIQKFKEEKCILQ